MWMEKLDNGKFRYIERYDNPYTNKRPKVSVTLNSNSSRARNEARRILEEKIRIKKEKLNNIDVLKNSDITFYEFSKKWMTYYENTVKPKTSTTRRYPLAILNENIPKDYLLNKIDSDLFQDILEELYFNGGYSFNYVKQIKTTANLIVDYAVKKKYIEKTFMDKVVIKRKPKTLKEVELVENKYLEKNELSAIILRQRNSHNGKRNADLTEFLALTGMRIGEAISLQVTDYQDTYVLIKGTLDYISKKYSDVSITTTKTAKSTRKVELCDRSKQILDKVIQENKFLALRNNYNDRDLIFTSIFGNPINISTYNSSLATACKHLKIKKHVTSHFMRHTHISFLAEDKVPLNAIMDRVGHDDAETTIKVYMHVTDKMKVSIIDCLNKITF